MPLSPEDYLQVLRCIEEIHRCRTLADFPHHVLRGLNELVPNNLAALNEVNVGRNRIVAVALPEVLNLAELTPVWEKYSAQHPVFRHNVETGDGQALKISDFLSVREFHRLEIYRELYRQLDAEDQLGITIRSDGGILLNIAFNRAQRDFTEADRVKLNLMRPHILQAYANAEELDGRAAEKADLQTALRETGHGLLAIDARGQVTELTPGALACARQYVDGLGPGLPAALGAWWQAGGDAPFTASAEASRLIVRRVRRDGSELLLLSEEHIPTLPGSSPMTPREREVLHWLAEGKTNGEIATILSVAHGTVKKHVERILAKLGVDNRTAATVLAREAGSRR